MVACSMSYKNRNATMLATNWFPQPFEQLPGTLFEHHPINLLEHSLNVGWQRS